MLKSHPSAIPIGEDRPKTKNNRPRSNIPKANITENRLNLRNHLWVNAREQIRAYVHAQPGRQSQMAHALGISDSQIHRYLCTKCEHDQEPSFSIGVAMLLYVSQELSSPIVENKPETNDNRNT